MDSLIECEIGEKSRRKLASVQVIEKIFTHEYADRLELAMVLGWQVIIQKNIYKEGDKIVYIEIDSKLPEKSWSEDFRKANFEIKTKAILKKLSQGLVLPLKILGDNINPDDYSVGDDLTDILGVTKYENDADLIPANDKKNKSPEDCIKESFPIHLGIPKTEEVRIQSYPKLLEKMKGKPYYATLKYDGMSATYLFDISSPIESSDGNMEYKFLICSRNFVTSIEAYRKAAEIYGIKEKLAKLDYKIAIQCEIYGPKIANNPLGMSSISIAVFNIFDLVNKRFFDMKEMEEFCNDNSLPMVQIIEKGENFNFTINELKEKSKGFYPNTKNLREGLVFRTQTNFNPLYPEGVNFADLTISQIEKYIEVSDRYSFKIINDDFLLKKK